MSPLKIPRPLKNMNKPVLIALVAGLLLLTAGGLYAAFFSQDLQRIDPTATTVIYRDNFASTVQVQGSIDSSQDMEIYTSQTAPVKEIYVEEYDSVSAGQVLAILDDGDLRDQIAIKEAATGVSARSAAEQVRAAENRYNAARRALAQGTNAALVSARSNVHVAHQNWQTAERSYQDLKRSIDEGYHPELAGQDTSSDSNQAGIRNAQTAYDQARSELDRNHKKLSQARSDRERARSDRDRLRQEDIDIQGKLAQAQRDLAEEQARTGNYDALQAQVESAEATLASLQRQYDLMPEDSEARAALGLQIQQQRVAVETAKKLRDDASSGSVSAAASRVDNLTEEASHIQYALKQAETDYSTADANVTSYEEAQSSLENAIETARLNLETALAQSRRTQTNTVRTQANLQDQLASAHQSADHAQQAYEDAQQALAAAEAAANDEVQTLEDNIRTTAAAGDNSAAIVELARLWENLEEMTIRAPVAGVVTQIQARVGMIPTGPLFKIESTNDLLVETELKEFDVKAVKEGMRVELKTDATGEQVFSGAVVSIAPVSSQHAASGDSFAGPEDSGQPTFKTVIAIHGNPTQLKAGMEARLTIILSEEEDVIAVPYAAVYEKDDGSSAVLVARLQEGRKERYELKEVPVETGLENDLAIVVKGNLYDGDRVLLSPADYESGQMAEIRSSGSDES